MLLVLVSQSLDNFLNTCWLLLEDMTIGGEFFSGFSTVLTIGQIECLLQVFCGMVKVYDFLPFREFIGKIGPVVFRPVGDFDQR